MDNSEKENLKQFSKSSRTSYREPNDHSVKHPMTYNVIHLEIYFEI